MATESFAPLVEWFEELLWQGADDDLRVYAIIDGFWCKDLYARLCAAADISWAHLFQGTVALANIHQAPFIIALKRGHPLIQWLVNEEWGQGRGIYFTASTSAARALYGKPKVRDSRFVQPKQNEIILGRLLGADDESQDPLWLIRTHFRRFSDVEFEDDGRIVDFRYYDPATLRVYLPSCNDDELRKFFGPIRRFYAEGFCDIPAANSPHKLYSFAARFESKSPDGPPVVVFDGRCVNMTTGRVKVVPRLPSAGGVAGRQGGPHPMIRTAQLEAFEIDQSEVCKRELTALFFASGLIDATRVQVARLLDQYFSTLKTIRGKTKHQLIDGFTDFLAELRASDKFEVT